MFELLKDFVSLLKTSFLEWMQDKQTLTYFGMLALLYVLVSGITLLLMGTMLAPLYSNPENVTALFTNLGVMIVVLVLISLLQIGALFILQYLLIARALALKKRNPVAFSLKQLLRLLLVMIGAFFIAVFSLFKVRFLLVGICAVIALLLAIVCFSLQGVFVLLGILFLIIAILLAIAYALIVAYSSYRLSMSIPLFIEKGQGIRVTLRESWNLTRGHVGSIFVGYVVVGLLLLILQSVVGAPATLYSLPASLLGSSAELALMTNPFYYFLLIPTYIVQAYIMVVTTYFMIELYSRLTSQTKAITLSQGNTRKKASPVKKRKVSTKK